MRLLRLLPVLPVLAGLISVSAATAIGPSAIGCASAASAHHAALVIEHEDGSSLKFCIGFDADQVTGDFLLSASGVEYATQDYGSIGKAVCQIDSEPQQYPPGCWTASSPYWAMFVSRGGGEWTQSSLGISSQTFRGGDAEGFRYEGQSDNLTPPSSAGVCLTATPPPSAPPTPRATAPPKSSASAGHSAAAPAAVVSPPAPAPVSAPAAAATDRPASRSTPDVAVIGRPVASQPSPPFSLSGVVAAAAIGAALVVLMIVQVLRGRRRSTASNR